MTTFLMIARVLYDKGFQQYVDAAIEVKNIFLNVRFLLLGDVDLQYPKHVPLAEIEKYVDLGAIEYLGYRTDVVEIMKDADCIVHPSYYNEGMSRVLMEALALRKPVITTNIPGCREFVELGLNGFLCEPRSTESLTNALCKFLDLDEVQRAQMGEKGRMIAEKKFDIKNVISVYKKIISQST